MKKLVIAVVAVAALALAINNANAEEKYVAGGFEASGHINAGLGFDYVGTGTYGNSTALARDGWQNVNNYNRAKDFGFMLDEVELDLTKSFGENIKARTDIAFGDNAIGSPWNGVYLKQAYVTANIAAGNGIEWLFGRFDAPIGYEAVDRNGNNTITHSMIYNYNIRPRSLTGTKIYYAFSDAVDLHFWLANNMADGLFAFNYDKTMPAFGARLGYTWGDKAKESTVGLSAAAGSDAPKASVGKIGQWSYLVDLDFNIYATDAFVIGGEGIFRRNNALKGTTSTQIFGGILDLNYAFSDVWDGTLKYSMIHMNNGVGVADGFDLRTYGNVTNALGVAKGYMHEISLAGGYQITDGAKFKAEFRLDWTKYSNVSKNLAYTGLGMFEYSF